MNSNIFALLEKHGDVTTWTKNLSPTDVCVKFGIDIENDKRYSFFWDMLVNKKLVVEENLLNWCGYEDKKNIFLELLEKNANMEHKEVPDSSEYEDKKNNFLELLEKNANTEHKEMPNPIVLTALEFEWLLNQMHHPKAQEIRQIILLLKHVYELYTKYELQCANDKVRHAEEELLKKTNKLNITREKMREHNDFIRTNVAPRVCPEPINEKKVNCLALIRISPNQWYLVRRQREEFRVAINNVLEKTEGANVVHEWEGVSHSIAIGNELKQRFRELEWFAHGNTLTDVSMSESTYTDEDLKNAIDDIIDNNVLHQICKEADDILKSSQSQ